MAMPSAPWRDALRPASFRGCGFHVEAGGRAGGRRIAMHEYPKRDVPYAEDMGRRARAFTVSGYLIGPNYLGPRDRLIAALEAEGAGVLVHPTMGEMSVVCDRFSVSETRQRGGFCVFEMVFVEAGAAAGNAVAVATGNVVRAAADHLDTVSGVSMARETAPRSPAAQASYPPGGL